MFLLNYGGDSHPAIRPEFCSTVQKVATSKRCQWWIPCVLRNKSRPPGFLDHQTFVYICWIPVWVAGAFAFRGITTVGALQQDSTLCQHQCTWPWSNVKGKPEVIWKDSYSYIPIGDSSIGMSKNHLKSWQTIRTRWLPTCCSDWSFHAHCETKRRRREIRRQTGRQEWTSWPCCCWAAGVMQLSIYKLFIRVLGVVFNIVCDLLAVNSF